MKKALSEFPLAFVVGQRNLEGRIDVNYYKPEYREIVDKLKKSPFKLSRLGDIATLSHERWKKPTSGTFRYIEINDIDTFSAEIMQAKSVKVENAPSRAQMMLRENDIIVSTTRPYRGAIAFVSEEFDQCVCSTGFAVVRSIKAEIDRKYLLYFLHSNLGLKQLEQRMTGGNYPAITPQELLRVWIPLPPFTIQEKIAVFIKEAANKKEEMEKESEHLLGSIDDYLLSELGIILPRFEGKSPSIYGIGAGFLKRKRWDVDYWKPAYLDMNEAIKDGKFAQAQFESVIDQIMNGIDYRTFTEEGTKYLRVGNIKPFDIDETDIKHIGISLDDITKDVILEKGDILLTRKGTFGVATLIENDTEYIISSEIFRIKLRRDKEINPFYVVAVLNSSVGKKQFTRKSVGTIMGSLSQDAVKSILIPFPSVSIQDMIAKEVKARIERAKQLEQDAKKTLEEARGRAEKVILGVERI